MHDAHPESRLDNHVRRRMDGQGDGWANAHREALGNKYFLQDEDACVGMMFFGTRTENRIFTEWEPDDYGNRENLIRRFALIATFDRKSTYEAAFALDNTVSTAWYLANCRKWAKDQPKAPRFFYVIGGKEPPWELVELDINTGTRIGGNQMIDTTNMTEVWDAVGLTELRCSLRQRMDEWIT